MNTTLKKALTAALVASMVLGTTAMAFASPGKSGRAKASQRFSDWQQIPDWAQEAMTRMSVKGVIRGDNYGDANPGAMITNAEAAAMVVRFLGEEQQAQTLNVSVDLTVSDKTEVPDWAKAVVTWSVKNDLFELQNGRFNPNHPLTRLEAARLLVKAAKLEDEAKSKADATLVYKDARQISAAYVGYVAVAYDHGWMLGDPNGMFHPNKTITRAEWATLLNRADISTDVTADANQVKGAITAVTIGAAPSITVTTPVFPSGVTYPVDDTAVFYVGGKEATIADLQVGDNVLINLSADRKVLAVTVVIKREQVSGSVTAVAPATAATPGSISIEPAAATTVSDAVYSAVDAATYEVSPTAPIKIGDIAGTLADIKVGDKAQLTLERGKVVAVKVDVEVVKVEGSITAVTPGQNSALPTIAIKDEDGNTATYEVADFAQIFSATDATITIADLKVGDKVEARVQRGQIIRIKVDEAATQSVTLQVQGAN
ncbi:MAG: S-layer homology domain-containing protein [Symbiobacteriia bacterium]